MSIRVAVAGCSETHTRSSNQDRIAPSAKELPQCISLPHTFAVADGMGGTKDGEKGAIVATQELSKLDEYAQQLSLPEALRRYIQHVNHQIIQEAGGTEQTGSTLSILSLTQEEWFVGHVGDSRIYLLRDGVLTPLTHDHNAYAASCEQGHIPFFPNELKLSSEDIHYIQEHNLGSQEFFFTPSSTEESFPLEQKHAQLSSVLRGHFAQEHQLGTVYPVGSSKHRLALALGKVEPLPEDALIPPRPTFLSQRLQNGDLFLLCTDGLCGVLDDTQLQQRMQHIAQRLPDTHPDLSTLHWGCEVLLEDAIQAGSNDNISIQLLHILIPRPHPTPKPPDAQPNQHKPSPSQAAVEEKSTMVHPAAQLNEPNPIVYIEPTVSGQDTIEQRADWDLPEETDTHVPAFQLPTSVLYVIILCLLTALCISWWTRPAPQTTQHSSRKTTNPQQNTHTQGSSAFWFRMPLPELHDRPDARTYLLRLQKIHQHGSLVRSLWGLSQQQKQRLEDAFAQAPLRYQNIRSMLQKVPPERRDFRHFEDALSTVVVRVLEAIAPQYKRYLDEMSEQQGPSSVHSGLLSLKQRRTLRTQWITYWYGQWNQNPERRPWQIALMYERIVVHPHSFKKLSGVQKVQRLKVCIQHLRHAIKHLRTYHPKHPILPSIGNRLQLHQAHIQKWEESTHTLTPKKQTPKK